MVDAIWPHRQDYDDSMDEISQKVRDSKIKNGQVARDQTGEIVRFGGANNYVTLYKVDNWMIRCFCQDERQGKRPPSDIKTRYEYISSFCQQNANNTTPLVYIEYVPNALEVDIMDRSSLSKYVLKDTQIFPFVRMNYIEGLSLGTFVAKYHAQKALMENLCVAWLHMIQELEKLQMAHGDLDLTNIRVIEEKGQLVLKLIDYDNAWVPAFAHFDLDQTEIGHEHFQHPALASKKTRTFDQYMDRFSALTIYISLKALILFPTFYTDPQWGVSDAHLLFTKADYEAEVNYLPNNRIALLHHHLAALSSPQIPSLISLLQELRLCLQESRQPQSLTTLLSISAVPPQSIPNPIVVQLPTMVHETEYRRFAWEEAVYFKDVNEPLIPASLIESIPASFLPPIGAQPEQPSIRVPSYQPSVRQPEPDPWVSAPRSQQQQHVYEDVYVPPLQPSKSLIRPILVWSIVVFILLLILVVVLLNIFAPTHPSSFHALPFFAPHQIETHEALLINVSTSSRI